MIRNLVAFIFVLSAFLILLQLGFWQLQRLDWKQDLLAKIEAQEKVDPQITPLDLENAVEFQRGFVIGQYLNKPPIILTPRTNPDGEVGYHLLYPFQTEGGDILLSNLGWHSGQTYPVPHTSKRKLSGTLKSPQQKNIFTPNNRPDTGLWYWPDLATIQNHYEVDQIFPMILHLEGKTQNTAIQKPRNNHMQYAIFWFTMAGVLIILTGFSYWRSHHQN